MKNTSTYPARIAGLHTGLADVDSDALTHIEFKRFLVCELVFCRRPLPPRVSVTFSWSRRRRGPRQDSGDRCSLHVQAVTDSNNHTHPPITIFSLFHPRSTSRSPCTARGETHQPPFCFLHTHSHRPENQHHKPTLSLIHPQPRRARAS